jgi:hypothetical protein
LIQIKNLPANSRDVLRIVTTGETTVESPFFLAIVIGAMAVFGLSLAFNDWWTHRKR